MINKVGKSQYGNSFKLKRFTEIAWNSYSSKGQVSFHVELWEKPPDYAFALQGYPFHLAVDFMSDIPSEETMKALCNDLYSQTGVPTRFYHSGGFSDRLRYLIPSEQLSKLNAYYYTG